MQNDKLKNHVHLHFLVLIAGFTAILGELISIDAIPLVWFRMSIAGVLMLLFIKFKKRSLKIPLKAVIRFSIAGVIIALHWITFFAAIKVSNISITLAMFSTGAFFASLIEPMFYKRKIVGYEILFGVIVIAGVILITQTELQYILGITLGIFSALFATLFAVLNGQFVKNYKASVISFYEFVSGVLFISIFIALTEEGFNSSYFQLTVSDWTYLIILASICTAYAFIASIHVMKHITPYTLVLTYNLEPIYGILLAVIIFPQTETMQPLFYLGAGLIISTVLLNAVFKNINKPKI
jgi:drug/metabolite transporter (DMT)-like permease